MLQLKQQIEDHDKEITEVESVVIATVVKDIVKKSKFDTRKRKEDLPINEYLARHQEKIKRNEEHLKSLGLGSLNSRSRQILPRKQISPNMYSPKRKHRFQVH